MYFYKRSKALKVFKEGVRKREGKRKREGERRGENERGRETGRERERKGERTREKVCVCTGKDGPKHRRCSERVRGMYPRDDSCSK